MPIATGFGATLGIGVESTWGTAVARTNWLRLISTNAKRTIDRVPRPDLGYSGQVSRNRRAHFTATDFSGGRIEWAGAYDDSTVLLTGHGLYASATTGSGPYVHTATMSATQQTGLTMEIIKGTGQAEVHEGCLINAFELACESGGAMMCAAEFISETTGGHVSAGTPTYSSNGNLITHAHAGQLAFNSENHDLVSFRLRVEHSLARRNFLGSALTKKPTFGDFQRVSGQFVIEYDTATNMHSEFLADTQGDATLTFTSAPRSLALTFQNLYVTDVSDPISSAGIIRQTVDWVCESDGTDEGVKAAFTNANSAATAN